MGSRVVLQLHGGGYIATMKNAYRSFAALYSELGGNCRVLTIDYRVAPEHPYPAALEDTIAAYHWLLEQGYPAEKIVVAGDSAGGGLALALCLWLKNHKEPLPSGVIAIDKDPSKPPKNSFAPNCFKLLRFVIGSDSLFAPVLC